MTLGIDEASGGSRTRNPRITNAVLCQLKLRWRGLRGRHIGDFRNPAH